MNKKILDPLKLTPRCPLCHAMFSRVIDTEKLADLKRLVAETRTLYLAEEDFQKKQKIKEHGELLEFGIKNGGAEVFICEFCKIGCATNDPMAGRWEELYAQGEKIFCPACNHEMRFFCTSTGYVQAKCPVKTCQARWTTTSPDRKAGEVKMLNAEGDEVIAPNIDRAIATPENPAIGQVEGGVEPLEDMPEVFIPLPGPGKETLH